MNRWRQSGDGTTVGRPDPRPADPARTEAARGGRRQQRATPSVAERLLLFPSFPAPAPEAAATSGWRPADGADGQGADGGRATGAATDRRRADLRRPRRRRPADGRRRGARRSRQRQGDRIREGGDDAGWKKPRRQPADGGGPRPEQGRRKGEKKNRYCCSSATATRSTGLGLLEIPSPGGKIDPPGDGAAEMTRVADGSKP